MCGFRKGGEEGGGKPLEVLQPETVVSLRIETGGRDAASTGSLEGRRYGAWRRAPSIIPLPFWARNGNEEGGRFAVRGGPLEP